MSDCRKKDGHMFIADFLNPVKTKYSKKKKKLYAISFLKGDRAPLRN